MIEVDDCLYIDNYQRMGFEEVIPPVPTRSQEIAAMDKLRTSWLNQSYFKYYMNEALRIPKMKLADKLNGYYKEIFFNTALTMIISLPLVMISKRLFLTRGNVPITYLPDTFNKSRSDLQVRRWKHLKYGMSAWFFGSFIVGIQTADFSQVYDINYNYVHKPEKMM